MLHTIQGVKLAFADYVKYLGVLFDKINLESIFEKDYSRGKAIFIDMSKNMLTHWLYLMVVRPIITYGATA